MKTCAIVCLKEDQKYSDFLWKHISMIRRFAKNWNFIQSEKFVDHADADILLLMVTADFLNTYLDEMEVLMSYPHRKRTIVILCEACDYSQLAISILQALPRDSYGAKPINSFKNRDEAGSLLSQEITRVMKTIDSQY